MAKLTIVGKVKAFIPGDSTSNGRVKYLPVGVIFEDQEGRSVIKIDSLPIAGSAGRGG